MAGLAKATIIGNLGRDPEVKHLANGDAVCNFSLAVNEKRRGEESVEWYRVSAFGKLAEVCGQHLAKGRQVYVEGRLQQHKYKDKDGVEKLSVEVVANTVQFLGGNGERGPSNEVPGGYRKPSGETGGAGTGTSSMNPLDDDDLPF
jgi:single-strand DNA-binding protein